MLLVLLNEQSIALKTRQVAIAYHEKWGIWRTIPQMTASLKIMEGYGVVRRLPIIPNHWVITEKGKDALRSVGH